MKSFLKTVFAVMVGLFITGICSIVFVTCAMIGAAASSQGSGSTVATKPNDVLILKINGPVTEIPSSMPFSVDMLSGFSLNEDLSLRGYLNAIAIAAQDPNIKGIYLNTDGMTAAPASYEALRNALTDFRETTGKWVIAYNDNFSLGQYYVASAANELYVNTIGAVTFDGMSSTLLYPKRLLDKLDIEMQVFRVGNFKSAVEPYMIEHISEANRLQTETYLRNIWSQMTADIAASRNIPVERLDSLANEAVSYMQPVELGKTGLVDGQVYKSDVEKRLMECAGQDDELHGITAKDLVTNYETYFAQDLPNKVAVIYAVGEIASENTSHGEDGIYYDDLIKDIREVTDDDEVQAVVLRVNSPGGSGFASEQIWKALCDLKAKKPLVVSMGDYAASGGYYISCMANYIFAEPTTLTGSIGVFGVVPNFGGLATGRLGVNFEEVKTHQFSQITTMRSMLPAEKQKLQHGVEAFYELFVARCSEGRNVAPSNILNVGGGRVWTGSDAVRLGLVDELGGLDKAIAKAADMAMLSEGSYSRVNYPKPLSPMEQIMEMMGESEKDLTLRIADHLLGSTPADRSTISFINNLQHADHLQARMLEGVIY